MQLIVDNEQATANSRLTAIRLALLTSRCMENWRRHLGDGDKTMILLAVVAITGERLTRTGLKGELRSIFEPLPPGLLGECNISSIAAATGLNRETTRRKVNALAEAGILQRSADGEVSFVPGTGRNDSTVELLRTQLEAIVRFTNDSIRDGVLRPA
jgi:hypothetical protein